MLTFIVTEAAQRPARMDGTCFYCQQKIGTPHKPECVCISKKVRVRLTVEYDISVPHHWQKEMIEFARNDSSWCANNAITELDEVFDSPDGGGCMCNVAHFEHLADVGEPYLKEGGK